MFKKLLPLAAGLSLTTSTLVGATIPATATELAGSLVYANCTAVWESLGSPILRGAYGWSEDFDADHDGIGCESAPRGYKGIVRAAPLRHAFSDIRSGNSFYNEVRWLVSQGISTGYPDGSYKPLVPVERGAMAAFFYRMAGSPSYTPPAVARFSDVPTNHKFYKEISWLASQGITTGYPDGSFQPDAHINRDAMAAFFYRYMGSPSYSAPAVSRFTDIKNGDQFYKEVSWLASMGISTGYPDGTYRPLSPVNRDAMAAFIYRLFH